MTNEFNTLLSNKSFGLSYVHILDIKEIEYQEYVLTLKDENSNIYKGIYVNTIKTLCKGQVIKFCDLILFKSDYLVGLKLEDFILVKEQKKSSINSIAKNNYNFEPDKIVNLFSSINKTKYEGEEIFIINKKKGNDTIELLSPLNLKTYLLKLNSEFTKDISNLECSKFIYIKNYILEDDNNIRYDGLTILRKASDFDIFHLLESKIDFSPVNYHDFTGEIMPIKLNEKILIKINCLVSKVVLKDNKKQRLLIIDIFNRLIELDYNVFKNYELFDLVLITQCTINRSQKDIFVYDLKLSNESIIYSSKELIFDKRINLNNSTILDINFPDYKKIGNYYNKIIINNCYFEITNNRHIYIFNFRNELFNEIVPYKISCKNDKDKKISDFQFFIVNNLINKVNLFINYNNNDSCCKDFCFLNSYAEVPYTFKQTIDNKEYDINHYNSFDSNNKISFILINIPSDEYCNAIKKNSKMNNVSCQIWYIAQKAFNDNNKLEYVINQILNVDEAKQKQYYSYNLKDEKYLIFENFYITIKKYYEEYLNDNKNNNIVKYIEDFSKRVTNYSEIDDLLNKCHNVDYKSESVDYLSYKIYVNLSLYNSLITINSTNKEDTEVYIKFYTFFEIYKDLIEKLFLLKNKLTYHQKIRIIQSFLYFYFNGTLCELLIIDELAEDAAYKLAYNFNINIINNLTEKSALTQRFLQLDSFILKNYFINEVTYSLSNEPLTLMKRHLLLNYENFILIIRVCPQEKCETKALQDESNRITIINEQNLFNSGGSRYLNGKDYALPITCEFIHEKDSHSKKNFKNRALKSPLFCCKNYKNDNLDEEEDGRFIESIIGDKNFISGLKDHKNNLGSLMDVKYFVAEDFEELHSKYQELMKRNSEQNQISQKKHFDSDEKFIERKQKKKKNESELKTLEDFEDYYLFNGVFLYPDSFPFHEHYYGDKPFEKSEGEKEFLKKYELDIKRAKAAHYGWRKYDEK